MLAGHMCFVARPWSLNMRVMTKCFGHGRTSDFHTWSMFSVVVCMSVCAVVEAFW